MHDTPMFFWVSATNMTCQIANNPKYFETFYILRDRENLGKFDPKFDLGIILVYSTKNKAYRVYNQSTRVIQESLNVVIDDSGYAREEVNYDNLP